jgi:adhesin transport system outer membrane protein
MGSRDQAAGCNAPARRLRALLAGALAVAAVALAGGAGGADARTLKESVAITVQRYPEIQRDKALSAAADKAIDQAFSSYLPNLNLDQEFGYEWTNSPSTRTRATRTVGIDPGSVSRVRRDSNVTFRQMMFDGFETPNRVSSARYSLDTANFTVAETSERVALRVVLLYLDVLRTRMFVDITQENLNALAEIAGQIRELAQAGRGTGSDVDQADSRVYQGRAAIELRKGENNAAIARYIEVVGEVPVDLVLPDAPQYQRPTSEEEAVAFALAHHPSGLASASFYKSRQADADAAWGPFYPRFDFETLASTGSNLDGNKGRDSDINPRLRLRQNVFNGMGDWARVGRTREEAVAAKEDDAEQRRRIREEVRVSYRNLKTAEERLAPLKSHAVSAKQVLEGYRSQFELGKRSLLDLLDVQNELLQARLGQTDGEFRVLLANYELISAQGVLLDQFGMKSLPAKGKTDK